jgi:hypothetical protein
MTDIPSTVRRERIGHGVDRLKAADLARLNLALALVMGVAD